MIPQEVVRIDIDLFDDAAQPKLDDTPIMSRRAAAARLPSVHPFTAVRVLIRDENSPAGLQEILLLGKELIVCEKGGAADSGRSQINEAGRRRHG